MKLISFEVTNELYSLYYSPVIRIHYSHGPVYCNRLVLQDKTSKKWIFMESRTECPVALSKLLTEEYNKRIEIRRSSRPPPPKDL